MKGIVSYAIVMTIASTTARAGDVVIDWATVANPGNAGELSGSGPTEGIVGGVGYRYNIGQFEVTAGQYTEFLNAVAATDTYELFNPLMWFVFNGCKIQRNGAPGNYTYSVAADRADRPVNYVSWADAARFANWMHNGQSTGPQGPSTTEDGSYFLNGATELPALAAVTREPDATWVLPSEDEWYKAAYHKNDGVTGNYFDYPTKSDTVPSNALDLGGNNATFYDNGFTIGGPYLRTEAGAHENSKSAYGTFDQGGNVWEWNESIVDSFRGLRGGSFDDDDYLMRADFRFFTHPSSEDDTYGFRLAQVPVPATLSLLAFGGVVVLGRRRR